MLTPTSVVGLPVSNALELSLLLWVVAMVAGESGVVAMTSEESGMVATGGVSCSSSVTPTVNVGSPCQRLISLTSGSLLGLVFCNAE